MFSHVSLLKPYVASGNAKPLLPPILDEAERISFKVKQVLQHENRGNSFSSIGRVIGWRKTCEAPKELEFLVSKEEYRDSVAQSTEEF